MKTFSQTVVCAFMLLGAVSTYAADKSADLPTSYPGQSGITISLRKFMAAQKLMETGASKEEIVKALKDADQSIQGVRNNKGSFRATAIRLSGQALKHFEQGDKEAATRELEETIENVHKAGKAGSR